MRAAKARLFEGVGAGAPRVAVINADDRVRGGDEGCCARGGDGLDVWASRRRRRVSRVFWRRNVVLSARGAAFELVTPVGVREVRSPLIGTVQC